MKTQPIGLAVVTGACSGFGAFMPIDWHGAVTTFWDIAGKPIDQLPKEIVMTTEDMVDAALAGLDQGEFVTIPAPPNAEQWQTYEARQALLPYLSRQELAARYAVERSALALHPSRINPGSLWATANALKATQLEGKY
jgi:hypothetical protein